MPRLPESGHLARNVMLFVRLLREAGLRAGPDRALIALEALSLVGLERREDVRSALCGVLVDAPEQRALFDMLFDAIWQPGALEQALLGQSGQSLPGAASRAAPHLPGAEPDAADGAALREALNQRLARALASLRRPAEAAAVSSRQADTRLGGFTRDEQFQKADFRSMTVEEFEAASRLAEGLIRHLPEERSRRVRAASNGRADLRASLRRAARSPLGLELVRTAPRKRPRSLVLLCDVSGSMQRYARLMLHWAHALTAADPRTETLALGTRLTRISRRLRHRDPDEAIAATLAEIIDWGGGTRLGSCLEHFNQLWARRVLGARTTVLLLTDGLDREDTALLAREAARLRRHCGQLIWLNPLLRFEGFEPRAAGVRALLPAVDAMLPVHNLQSLSQLPQAIAHHRRDSAAQRALAAPKPKQALPSPSTKRRTATP